MTTKVELAAPNMTLKEAAAKMNEGDFGFMPVSDKEKDRLIGVVTDRDITVRAVAKGLEPLRATVWDVCSHQVFYCYEDQTVEDAARNMGDNQIRRLPVLNRKKRLVGVVSLGDLARAANSAKDQVEEALCQISSPAAKDFHSPPVTPVI